MGSPELPARSAAPKDYTIPARHTKVVKKKAPTNRKSRQAGRTYLNGLMDAKIPVHSDLMTMYMQHYNKPPREADTRQCQSQLSPVPSSLSSGRDSQQDLGVCCWPSPNRHPRLLTCPKMGHQAHTYHTPSEQRPKHFVQLCPTNIRGPKGMPPDVR